MKDELWMQKIKERLEDYSEPLPASGWERLERDLNASHPPVGKQRRIMPFRRWAMAAAAGLLVAVSTVSVWLLQSNVGDEVRQMEVPRPVAVAEEPLALPDNVPSSPLLAQQATDKSVNKAEKRQKVTLRQVAVAADSMDETEDRQLLMHAIEQTDAGQNENRLQDAETDTEEKSAGETLRARRYSRPSGKDKLHLPVDRKNKGKSRGWSVGLSVGNNGGWASADMAGTDNMVQNNSSGSGYSGRIDLATMADGIMDVPEGKELVFKNGVPYLQPDANQIADVEHRQPLTFGFSVRKSLGKGFSVETGLTYTYLASEVEFVKNAETLDQKLHYLGIPLRANWNFVDKQAFTLYVSAGGAVEKCIYGKIGSERETVKPLQLSVMGAVGAQYNISRRVGIYLEPGVSYFFDDGSPVQTIRKENPCNFTLQGGIRLTY